MSRCMPGCSFDLSVLKARIHDSPFETARGKWCRLTYPNLIAYWLTGTCNGHEHLSPLRSSYASLLEPRRRKANSYAKELKLHGRIGPNELGTDNNLVVTRMTVVRTHDQSPEKFHIGAAGISFTYYPQQHHNWAESGIHSVSIEGWCSSSSGRDPIGEL